ncbi:AlpA family phage regulatory protein [Vibrio fluvialis]|uniref:helix-turn-helix transcriptional regulator n=1 Tax=Vibrio sp. LQ2 TaxID=2883075 RepID=UPI001C9D1F8E|nr:AlpA family phage regulatory protein [Vibrio fluvialis]USP05307.1 AlpA family phage regulatory protein [Vibrio sp. LQ2]EKO5124697.1 AlpA family phage regulatory protein [Vibrio fluvialis]ELD1800088.1 AlpA family phage regulatory protein [Vibrio fluvialis]ELE5893338.1 AlpA family phage regulatory protein [Vibrio fluvialis]
MEYDFARDMVKQLPQHSLRIIRKTELAKKLGVSVRTIHRMVKQNRLPRPLYSPCGNINGWLVSDIDGWQKERLRNTQQ